MEYEFSLIHSHWTSSELHGHVAMQSYGAQKGLVFV